ncbi:MAG: RHS repeat protein, partial [Ruminococcaceae bacterium]|nr:RHS repeat protein [Oscillospiraceae bacterium]
MHKLPWKRLLSLLLTLTLVVQLLPLDVFAAEISETTTTEEQPISTAVEVSEAVSPTVVGEVEELRTEDGKQFRMSDGSYMAVSYGMPVHFQGATGEWTDIDNTLVNTTTTDGAAALVSTNGSASASFAGTLSAGQVFSAAYGAQNISMSMVDASTVQQLVASYAPATEEEETVNLLSDTSIDLATFSRTATATVVPADTTISAGTEEQAEIMAAVYPETLESSVLYEDVYPGVDLLYNLTGYNIKESIIVNEPLDSYHFTFLLELEGLTPQMQEDGSINLYDANNEVAWFIPAPYMFDSQNHTSSAVEYTLTNLGTAGALLTVAADATWINSTERAFPVTIDPTFYQPIGDAYGDIYATYVEQGNNTSHGHFQQLYLGYTAYQSLGERWIYLHFNNLPQIPQGSIVVNAALNLWQFDYSHGNCPELPVGAYEVTSNKASDETYHDWIYYMKWSDKATYDSANMIDYATASEATNWGYLSWDLTELFNKWYDTGTENRTLALVPTDTGKFSSSYYGIPVFYAYGQNHPPILMVSYRNNTGIEPYYTYQTMGAGHAGTAYISDYSGQLTVAKELFSLASTVNPFSIQMVYNSAYFSQTTDSQYDLCADLGMEMHVGSGWTYNFLQHVKEDTIDGVPYIRYLDGDGTIHYFAEDASKEEGYFYDEDGLGLKINEYYDNYYAMTDDHGNEWVFVRGYLLWIKDSNGNRIQIEYSQNGTPTTSHYPPSTGARIERIYQQNVGQSRVDIATFHYTTEKLPGKTQDEADDIPVPNYLSSIEDGAGNTYSFAYNHGKLSSILYNGQEIAHYSMWYNNGYYQNQMDAMTDVEAGYSLNFSYTNHRVSAVEETADVTVSGGDLSTGEDGVRIEIGRTDDGWTVYTDPGADRTTGTADDLHTYYGFDYFGRTVNGYTTDASDNIIGASNAVYSGTGSTDRTNNRTMRTASIGVAAQQELQNFGFEMTGETLTQHPDLKWSTVSSSGASSSVATTLPRTGARSLKLTIPASSTTAYAYARKTSNLLQKDTTYILSAYVNTSQATTFNGDGIYLKVQDTSGNTWTSDCVNYQTSSLVDDGWVRISFAFTTKVKCNHTITIYSDTIGGNSYVDDLQLEKAIDFVTGTDQTSASAVSNVNLLENGSLQHWGRGWIEGTDSGAEYVKNCGVHSTSEYAYSIKVTGNPTADNHAAQTVNLNLPSDQTYVLSGWAMANAVPDNVMEGDPETDKDAAGKDKNKQFGLRAIVRYANSSTPEYHYVPFNPDLSGWQFTSLTIVPRQQKENETDPDIIVASIEVQCAYEKNGNAAWFDNLSLVREAAQTMKYDEKGNLVSVTTSGIKADADTYEGGNLIKTVTGGNGTYEYKYDDTSKPHRLTSVVNTLVSQEMTYNTTGNVTKTTLFATENEANQDKPAYGKTLESSSEYDSEGASGNLMSSTTDTSDQTVTYDYEGDTNRFYGRTTEIIDAAGTTTTMGYDRFGRVLEKELWEKDAVANTVGLRYTYTKGILSQVRREDAGGNTQTYGYDHDSFGNLTEITVGDIVLAEYIYGPQNGDLLEQTYGNGDSVAYEYDNLGRTTKATYSSGRTLSYTYTG